MRSLGGAAQVSTEPKEVVLQTELEQVKKKLKEFVLQKELERVKKNLDAANQEVQCRSRRRRSPLPACYLALPEHVPSALLIPCERYGAGPGRATKAHSAECRRHGTDTW